jgi:hypothetical protein
VLNLSTWSFLWLPQYKVGGRNGFTLKTGKVSSSNQYGIAPFDASKELKKLTSWDLPPTETEMEEIKPLLARIQALKSGRGGALSGTQLMAFFLQRRVQPLQHRLSKLWSFSSLGDSSRVSDNLLEKKDLDKCRGSYNTYAMRGTSRR